MKSSFRNGFTVCIINWSGKCIILILLNALFLYSCIRRPSWWFGWVERGYPPPNTHTQKENHQPHIRLCIPVLSRVMSKVAICQYQYVNANILFPVFIASEGRDLIVVCNVQQIFLTFQYGGPMFRLRFCTLTVCL